MLIFDVSGPSKIVPKSIQKRLQNQLYVGYPLGTLKNTIFDVKTSPRWGPKISNFFQKSTKNATYHGLCSKKPLGSLQEPAKSLPGPSQEPFKGLQEAPKSLQEAPCSLPRVVSEAPKRCPRLVPLALLAFRTFDQNFNKFPKRKQATIGTSSWYQ